MKITEQFQNEVENNVNVIVLIFFLSSFPLIKLVHEHFSFTVKVIKKKICPRKQPMTCSTCHRTDALEAELFKY